MEKQPVVPIRICRSSRLFGSKLRIYKNYKTQQGQAVILAVIILPLLAISLNYFLQFLVLLHTHQKLQKNCRIHAHRAQKILIHGFNSLVDLNPKAKKLRQDKRNALRGVRLAIGPYAKAAALAYLAYVETQQRLLSAKQNSIINTSISMAKIEITKIKGQKYSPTPPFSLSARPKLSVTPSYYKSIDFERRQEIIIPWQYTNTLGQIQEGACGSYVKNSLRGFIAKLSYPDI